MKHALYEHPVTHQFALIRLPNQFADGDPLAIPPSNHWFSSRQEAMAALPELFNQNEDCASDDPGR